VQIGSYPSAEFGEVRIAIAWLKIAQNLIVCSVFFDDVNHVLNMLAQEVHRDGIVGRLGLVEMVIEGYLLGEEE